MVTRVEYRVLSTETARLVLSLESFVFRILKYKVKSIEFGRIALSLEPMEYKVLSTEIARVVNPIQTSTASQFLIIHY